MTAATSPGANTWNDLRGGITNATTRPPIIDPTILARALDKVGHDLPAVGAVLLSGSVAAA